MAYQAMDNGDLDDADNGFNSPYWMADDELGDRDVLACPWDEPEEVSWDLILNGAGDGGRVVNFESAAAQSDWFDGPYNCPRCHADVRGDGRYCRTCGYRFEQA